jgi:signal transduction histidine kinase
MRELAGLEFLALLAVQALVITMLVAERRTRRRVERALQDRVGFETMLSSVVWEFAHGEPEHLPEVVAQALRHVATYVQVDRLTLVNFADSGLSFSVQRPAANGHRDPRLLPVAAHTVAEFPASWKMLARGLAVSFSSVTDLPPGLAADREAFTQLGVEALLALPINSEGTVAGALVVGTIGQRRDWPEDLIQRMRLVANVFAGVMVRQNAERAARRSAEEVTHLSRTRTMGEFAASLAHELSQPLAAILANAQAGRRFLAGGRANVSEVRAILEDIDADDQRAGEMIRRMRALFKRHEVEVTCVDLNEVVREAVGLVHSEAVLRRVTLVLDLADGLGPVRADRIQVQQVLLNLILNAFEALSAPGVQGANRRVMLRTSLGADGYADVGVRDSGPGIPPEHLDRLFGSYFTTKRDGLGMGLSISQSIAQGHGGRLWATNNSDSGATFHLALPLFSRTIS